MILLLELLLTQIILVQVELRDAAPVRHVNLLPVKECNVDVKDLSVALVKLMSAPHGVKDTVKVAGKIASVVVKMINVHPIVRGIVKIVAKVVNVVMKMINVPAAESGINAIAVIKVVNV